MYNGPLKGGVYSVLSCFIKNSLTPLLLSPHPIHVSFGCGIDEVLGILKDMG